jgi:hypothetical protein
MHKPGIYIVTGTDNVLIGPFDSIAAAEVYDLGILAMAGKAIIDTRETVISPGDLFAAMRWPRTKSQR